MSEAEAMRADFESMLADLAGAPVCLAEQDDNLPCMREATVTIEGGCVHEHTFTMRVCEDCAVVCERGEGVCNICRRSGDVHDCRVLARRVP